MPLAIITSDPQSRHSMLLLLNITGVFACICTKVLLVLTALNVIFEEPDVSLVMQNHVANYSKLSHLMSRKGSDDSFPPIEDTYLFYLDMLLLRDLLM